MKQIIITIFNLTIFIFVLGQTPHNMVFIKGGTYVPLYSLDSGKAVVNSFYMDKYPVTNAEFEKFVLQNPQWHKNKVKAIFADKNYLKNWKTDSTFGIANKNERNSPVIYISWFAAKKYCECQGKRLLTVKEWEFVALASETKKDASGDAKFSQKILDWYGKPTPKQFAEVGKGFRN
ncbi:MAG TPA: SUMF1/EgtB/PvdO family nonheme iron enzyme, partial [Chitinophagales bacterium]|nr:SUMF1/EgtB/PvdO family nonheme iron enzyme [Chitinophagales bacterium]